ncbi:hypothetical protein, partial [Yinghuangia soli]
MWGTCLAVDGLFTDLARGTYELFGWIPEGAEPRGWVGNRVWLVPEDKALDAWLLGDAESPGAVTKAGSLALVGEDDYLGPPEGYWGTVRVHDEEQWLGSCREFTKILPAENPLPPLLLRGLAPSSGLREVLAKGTRKSLDLEDVVLDIRDDQGDQLADFELRAKVEAWRPSPCGTDLIDLQLARHYPLLPQHAQPLWEQWFAGPPATPAAWAGLDTRKREVWLDLVRRRTCARTRRGGGGARAPALDGAGGSAAR